MGRNVGGRKYSSLEALKVFLVPLTEREGGSGGIVGMGGKLRLHDGIIKHVGEVSKPVAKPYLCLKKLYISFHLLFALD